MNLCLKLIYNRQQQLLNKVKANAASGHRPSATGFFERLCHLLNAHLPAVRPDPFSIGLTDLWSYLLPDNVRYRLDLCITATEPEGLSVIDAGPCSDPGS